MCVCKRARDFSVLRSAIFSSTGVWRHQRPLTGDYGGKPKRVAFMMTKSKGNTLAKWRNKRMLLQHFARVKGTFINYVDKQGVREELAKFLQ